MQTWLAKKLQRKLGYTQDNDGQDKSSKMKSIIRTKANQERSLKNWLSTGKSPKTRDAKERFAQFLYENKTVEHEFRSSQFYLKFSEQVKRKF